MTAALRPRAPQLPRAALADRLLRHRDGAPSRRHDHAARDDRDELPARDPPPAERRSRRVGAAARRPRHPSGARGDARTTPARSARSRTPPSRSRSGSRTTCSGTCPGSTTRRSSTRTRFSTSSTRSTSRPEWRCGGASCRTSRTGSERALARRRLRRLRPREPDRARPRARPRRGLRLLRRRAGAALGALARSRTSSSPGS